MQFLLPVETAPKSLSAETDVSLAAEVDPLIAAAAETESGTQFAEIVSSGGVKEDGWLSESTIPSASRGVATEPALLSDQQIDLSLETTGESWSRVAAETPANAPQQLTSANLFGERVTEQGVYPRFSPQLGGSEAAARKLQGLQPVVGQNKSQLSSTLDQSGSESELQFASAESRATSPNPAPVPIVAKLTRSAHLSRLPEKALPADESSAATIVARRMSVVERPTQRLLMQPKLQMPSGISPSAPLAVPMDSAPEVPPSQQTPKATKLPVAIMRDLPPELAREQEIQRPISDRETPGEPSRRTADVRSEVPLKDVKPAPADLPQVRPYPELRLAKDEGNVPKMDSPSPASPTSEPLAKPPLPGHPPATPAIQRGSETLLVAGSKPTEHDVTPRLSATPGERTNLPALESQASARFQSAATPTSEPKVTLNQYLNRENPAHPILADHRREIIREEGQAVGVKRTPSEPSHTAARPVTFAGFGPVENTLSHSDKRGALAGLDAGAENRGQPNPSALEPLEGDRRVSSEVQKTVSQPTQSRPDGVGRSVAQQMAAAITHASDGTIDVRLSPEDLGRVKLALTPGDLGLLVSITTERPDTLELVRRNIELLAQDLRQNGFQNPTFDFGQDAKPNKQQTIFEPLSTPDPSQKEQQDSNETSFRARATHSDGRLDIRL